MPVSETASPEMTPTRVPGVPASTAVVPPSYGLSFAVMPEMVRFFCVILADRVGCVSE